MISMLGGTQLLDLLVWLLIGCAMAGAMWLVWGRPQRRAGAARSTVEAARNDNARLLANGLIVAAVSESDESKAQQHGAATAPADDL